MSFFVLVAIYLCCMNINFGAVSEKELTYLPVTEVKNWEQYLPNKTWSLIIISSQNPINYVRNICNKCIKNHPAWMCSYGQVESVYDSQEMYLSEIGEIKEDDFAITTSHRSLAEALYFATIIADSKLHPIDKVVCLNLDPIDYSNEIESIQGKINQGYSWNQDKQKWQKGRNRRKLTDKYYRNKKIASEANYLFDKMTPPKDPKRIQEILGLVDKMWQSNPDWRLGQLIINIIRPKQLCSEVFSVEDDIILEKLYKLTAISNDEEY
jgi:uncharacterized protein YihD (DUF1040 family)